MHNVLGPKNFEGEYKLPKISNQDVFLKMYGKKISKPLRKLGHFNILKKDNETMEQLWHRLDEIKKRIRIEPLN